MKTFFSLILMTLLISQSNFASGKQDPNPITYSVPDISIVSDPNSQSFIFMADPDFAYEVEILDGNDKMLGWAEAGEWVQGKITLSLGNQYENAKTALVFADGQSTRMVLSTQNPKFSVISNSTGSAPQTAGESGQGE